jgi:hypothetical protein
MDSWTEKLIDMSVLYNIKFLPYIPKKMNTKWNSMVVLSKTLLLFFFSMSDLYFQVSDWVSFYFICWMVWCGFNLLICYIVDVFSLYRIVQDFLFCRFFVFWYLLKLFSQMKNVIHSITLFVKDKKEESWESC